MNSVLALVVGVACAAGGGQLFVRGAVGVAAWARVPAGIIGATVAAFATSSPELAVALTAASEGQSEIVLGNALGGNLMNVGLVLGLAILIAAMPARRADLRRDLPVALAAPLVTGLLVLDGRLGRLDAVVLLGLFVAWFVNTVVHAARARSSTEEVLGEHRHGRAVLEGAAGLVLLVLAGRFIVVAAEGIGAALGLDAFVVGATLVAFGTATPELATTIISRLRGHAEIGLGTVIGSNIFNNLWIVGVAAFVSPVEVVGREVAIGITSSLIALSLVVPPRAELLRRPRGVLMLGLYVANVVALLATQA
jgi:cation:H+ antiporter